MSFARRQHRERFTADFAFAKPAPRVKAKPEPKKRKPIAWRSPKRIQREAVYGPFQDWLHGAGAFCVVCGTSINIQGSHVGIGGAGLKHGSAADQIRMCGPSGRRQGCHADWEQYRGFFAGWSNERRQKWSRDQRIAHWEAFRAWAGIELMLQSRDEDGVDPALFACDEAIGECLARIGGSP